MRWRQERQMWRRKGVGVNEEGGRDSDNDQRGNGKGEASTWMMEGGGEVWAGSLTAAISSACATTVTSSALLILLVGATVDGVVSAVAASLSSALGNCEKLCIQLIVNRKGAPFNILLGRAAGIESHENDIG